MIQLIMGKIKSKCKINLSRCRRWNQIDAPSVHRICSPEYGSLVAGAQGRVTKSNIQYGVESYFVSFTVLYVSGRPWRGWPELLRSPAYKTTTLRLCTYLRVGWFFFVFFVFWGFFCETYIKITRLLLLLLFLFNRTEHLFQIKMWTLILGLHDVQKEPKWASILQQIHLNQLKSDDEPLP